MMKKLYNSPKSFCKDYQKAYQKYWDDRAKIEVEIQKLQQIEKELFCPRLENEMYRIAHTIEALMKADKMEVTIHGGLSNRISVYFLKRVKVRVEKVIGYLAFTEYNNGKIALVSNLKKGQVIDLDELSIQDLVKFAKANSKYSYKL